MIDIKNELHEPFLLENGFYRDTNNEQFNPEGTCFTLLPENGRGHYWVYTCADLFSITIQDLILFDDLYMEYQQSPYLCIGYYDSISGEESTPLKRLSSACIRGYIGNNGIYQALLYKNIPIRCVGIIIMPEYYENYLRLKYPREYENPTKAFINIDGVTDCPELVFLLKQLKNNRSTGISAKLYYESKVAEAISLIIQYAKEVKPVYTSKSISPQDLDNLISVTTYINDNLDRDIHLKLLAKLACMGTTKLKYTFKEVYKSTIFEYILNKRILKAKQLLANTDLNIGQVAYYVGYKKSSSFSDIFQRKTGVLPNEYRKIGAKL